MVHLGQYIPRSSVIHQLDPRVKLAAVVALSIMILKGDMLTQCWITALLLILVPASRLNLVHLRTAFRPVLFFLGLLFFLHLLFTTGTPIPPFPPWPITVTYEGLQTGTFVIWQFSLLILSAAILTMTTPPGELIGGIERFLRPFQHAGIPSHDLALMISMAMRFVPTILDELNRIREAQTARGARFKNGPILQRMKATASLLMPLILGTMRRADALALAMESRGYRRGPRTYLRELRMGRKDYLALLLFALALGLEVGGRYLLQNGSGWPQFLSLK
ncbi:MAG: energy-coupling factor transporter transmembrane protein EcfT [Deltaproteobacteria bacterium]|nr:energy-coupling factor transporter transmembrane protein EcfT [Deltaproteobacteria bacterium]